MLEMLPLILPSVIELFTDKKEVVQLVAENQGLIVGAGGMLILDLVFRLVPTEKHKTVLSVLIYVLQELLEGAKKLDSKLSRKK